MNKNKGHFITFEGIDGSGKSTQIHLLRKHIEEMGASCYETAEPSTGPIGSLLRQFLSKRIKAEEATLATLFAADRLDHLQNETDGICQKLQNGTHVICDRYVLSNYAYQGVRVSLDWVMQLNSAALKILHPDCHIFIDVTPDTALERMAKGRFHTDLFETKERLTEVRSCYLTVIEQLKERETILIINGNQSVEKISEEIWQKVAYLFTGGL
jgi:dTMP kinase